MWDPLLSWVPLRVSLAESLELHSNDISTPSRFRNQKAQNTKAQHICIPAKRFFICRKVFSYAPFSLFIHASFWSSSNRYHLDLSKSQFGTERELRSGNLFACIFQEVKVNFLSHFELPSRRLTIFIFSQQEMLFPLVDRALIQCHQ